jgi:hypothetical protein
MSGNQGVKAGWALSVSFKGHMGASRYSKGVSGTSDRKTRLTMKGSREEAFVREIH